MKLTKNVYSGSIRSLRPVLEEWIRLVARYINVRPDDNPWWYNERASLSCLAAAAWSNNGIALEEYCTEKGRGAKAWSGRCDLFFQAGNQSFGCEAKQAWCSIGPMARSGIAEADTGLKEACADAKKLRKDEGRRLGLCFAVPYLPEKYGADTENLLQGWLKELKSLDYSSIAWIFPKNARYHVYEREVYPGVVLLVKEISFQK
jgi:hypothetical protein